jgi:zinc transporter ZupT
METSFLQLMAFGLAAALANVAGGAILLPKGLQAGFKKTLRFALALGAGFMLSVTFVEVIPKTVALWQASEPAMGHSDTLYVPMLLILGGYMLTQFFEHTIAPHFHLGAEVECDHSLPKKSAYSATSGFMIHSFFDGVSVAAASALDFRIGLLVFIAVFLHKFPEGFTIGSMLMAAGQGTRQILVATGLVGATTLLGVIVFYLIGSTMGFTVAYALPLACGVTLYVAASDLIPEINHHGGKKPLVSLFVFAGVALFFVLHFAVHSVLGTH